MITLHSFGQGFGVIDPSPYVVKVDLFLRMAELPFNSAADVKYLKEAPKNKLPYITDDNLIIGDSHFILAYLTQKYQITLDEHLTDEQKAQAYLFTKAIDEGLYWCLVYSRWVHKATWPIVKADYFGGLIKPLRWLLPIIQQKRVIKALNAQGTGRHAEHEIIGLAKDYFDSLSVLLGEEKYFFGDKQSSFDVVAFAMLSQFILVNFDNAFNRVAREYHNLMIFCQRMQAQFY